MPVTMKLPATDASASTSFQLKHDQIVDASAANLTTLYQPFAELPNSSGADFSNSVGEETQSSQSESSSTKSNNDSIDLYSLLASSDSGSIISSSSQMDSTMEQQQPTINSSSEWLTTEADIVNSVPPQSSATMTPMQSSGAPSWISKHNSSSSSSWPLEHRSKQPQPKVLESSSFSSSPLPPPSSSQHRLATIATIANSFSAILPNAQNQQNNRKDYSNSISSSPPITSVTIGNISGDEDNDYDWSSQDYQFMINLSIGGIILTTVVLLLFLLWLCCSKNDRDQYSIRKVPKNHHHHHHNDPNSINTSADSIDVVINPNHQKQRRSNCSLYISNPNSEDSQPDLQCGSIMFHNQMATDQKPVTVIRQYNADYGGKVDSHRHHHGFDASILQPIKCCNYNNGKMSMMVGTNWINDPSNDKKDGAKSDAGDCKAGSQLARNLASYCEQQLQNHRQTDQDRGYCGANPLDGGKCNSLHWPSSTILSGQGSKLNRDLHETDRSILPNDSRANFTKKRRNRMLSDSAAAIALNRSGLLLIAIDENTNPDQNVFNSSSNTTRASPDAILTYYDKISNLEQSNKPVMDINHHQNGGAINAEFDDFDDIDNNIIIDKYSNTKQKKKHQTSPETSSGDSIILNNPQPPIVVYNERTAL